MPEPHVGNDWRIIMELGLASSKVFHGIRQPGAVFEDRVPHSARKVPEGAVVFSPFRVVTTANLPRRRLACHKLINGPQIEQNVVRGPLRSPESNPWFDPALEGHGEVTQPFQAVIPSLPSRSDIHL